MEKRFSGDANVSQIFVTALAIVSILGFLAIVSKGFFDFDLTMYVESFLMLIIGTGLILEAKVKKLKTLSTGINSNNLAHLITFIIGIIAVLAGIFSFPVIRFENPTFEAIKAIISIIAIAVIIIQTWIID